MLRCVVQFLSFRIIPPGFSLSLPPPLTLPSALPSISFANII